MRASLWCSTSRPSASRIPGAAAISDPGSHSPDSSLPLMRRRASTLAGPQTAVFVGGKRFEVPVKISSGPFVAHEGYFTEGHMFGAIRAGTISYRLKTRPARMAVGEQWILEGDGRVIIYRIESNDPDGKLRIARTDAPGKSIEAFATGDGLRITRIGSLADGRPQGGLDLAFDEAGISASRWKARRSYRDRQRRSERPGRPSSPFLQRSRIGPWRDRSALPAPATAIS